ncbi:MAG: hypothetical protein GEU97_12360 [Actinophytocola sp.]|nr:hypothetical protein [Actinophytocola sp.]
MARQRMMSIDRWRRPLGSVLLILGVGVLVWLLAVYLHADIAGTDLDDDDSYHWQGESLYVRSPGGGWCTLRSDGQEQQFSLQRRKVRSEQSFDVVLVELGGASVPARDTASGTLTCSANDQARVITGWPIHFYFIAETGFPVLVVAAAAVVGGHFLRRSPRR